jgi:magnesium transporter
MTGTPTSRPSGDDGPTALDVRLRTASAHASINVPLAQPDDSVVAVLTAMRGRQFDSAAVVAVCAHDRLRGLATVERLFAAPPESLMADVMDRRPPTVTPDTDQEHAAWQAVKHGEPGLAVVDAAGRFGGLVLPHRLLGVLLQEHDEDFARLGGYLRSTASARAASVESIPMRLWHRLPWLAMGLAGAMISAGLMAAFETQLQANLLIAFFVPGIVYLADAVGTQTETLAIRGLSVGVGLRSVAGREALTGLFVGILLGVVLLPGIILIWGDVDVAAAVALSVVAASSIATLVALALPGLLHRLGRDPAFGSGPLATVIQDLLSILIYFTVASALLS